MRHSNDITETELAILDVLWRCENVRVRDIVDRLYPEGGASKTATVHSLLERLEQKGFVRRDRSSFAHTFHAEVERGDFVGSQLRQMADKVFDGSLTPILMNLAKEVRLSSRERAEILRLIESAQPEEDDS